jgi:hypothetical protein
VKPTAAKPVAPAAQDYQLEQQVGFILRQA